VIYSKRNKTVCLVRVYRLDLTWVMMNALAVCVFLYCFLLASIAEQWRWVCRQVGYDGEGYLRNDGSESSFSSYLSVVRVRAGGDFRPEPEGRLLGVFLQDWLLVL
jgi:hypothetical protein